MAQDAGRSVRRYEVFLPAADGAYRQGLPLTTSLADPIAFGWVGVSAADGDAGTPDDPKWSTGRWGGRRGNEGKVGAPARVFRVRREKPPAPRVPPTVAERYFATPADYHGHSYYTLRWLPMPYLRTHVFRALDEILFQVDWSKRPRPTIDASQLEFFPNAASEPRWDDARRVRVAQDLNRLNDFGHDTAGAGEALAYYQGLSDDALRVLAGLPGNEDAFSQLTSYPLDPDLSDNADRRGPDDPESYTPDPNVRAYTNELDGRARNRYCYRTAYSDGAHNRGPLSLSGPPVGLPRVVPPAAPLVQRALADEGRVRLQWLASAEPDIARYRIYRAANRTASSDIGTMVEVARVASEPTVAGPGEHPPSPVADRAAWLEYADSAPPGQEWYYRIVAEDQSGNSSPASSLLQGRSLLPPLQPAAWSPPARADDSVSLSWTHPTEPHLTCLVERRAAGGAMWVAVSGWLPPGVYNFLDTPPAPTASWEYRLWVRDQQGRMATEFPTITVPGT